MNIQQLFQSIQNEKDAFVDFYLTYDNSISDRNVIEKLFDDICSYQDVIENKDCIIFSIPQYPRYDTVDNMHSFAINRVELLLFFEKIQSEFTLVSSPLETYAYDCASIKELLGYQVSEACMYAFKNIYRYLASILYEISFHGYDLENRDIAVRNILEYLNQAVADIDVDETSNYIDFRELFKDKDLLNLDLDNIILPSDSESMFEKAYANANNKFSEELLTQLYCLEATYLLENGNGIND